MDIIRIQFQRGPYVHPKALISEINEGLRLTLHHLWTALSTYPNENNTQLAYHDTFDRINTTEIQCVKTTPFASVSHTSSLKSGLWDKSIYFTKGGGYD